MQSITDHLSIDHERCDRLFAALETAIAKHDTARAQTAFAAFHRAMQRHFAMEDAILFPAFETYSDEPTATHLMRMEHEQMRELIEQMQATLNVGNLQPCTALAGELSPLMRQHNLKEEQMLYPLLDRTLGEKSEELIQDIEALPQLTD